jgi:predicted lipoprotein with Yx(FWY)xxD motif
LDPADFGHITTPSGTNQITYKGWPLYHYAPPSNGANVPEKPGQTLGDGFTGLWYIAKPDYSIMIAYEQLTGHDGKDYKSDYTLGEQASTYFTDGKGVTLYTFTKDSANNNKFTRPDFSNNNIWPIYETDQVIVPSTLDKSQFGSISVFGRKQLTYKNWPLYYFGQDAGTRGSNKGISFPSPGIFRVPTINIQGAPTP